MASLLAEGGFASLSGTWSSASPATIADFRKGQNNKGLDGDAPNIYTVRNGGSTGESLVWVQIFGMHTTNSTVGTGTQGFPIWPGESQSFQMSEHNNEIALIKGWLTTVANATTSVSTTITGGKIGSRD